MGNMKVIELYDGPHDVLLYDCPTFLEKCPAKTTGFGHLFGRHLIDGVKR
jgi:hypothetical protein